MVVTSEALEDLQDQDQDCNLNLSNLGHDQGVKSRDQDKEKRHEKLS